jgi:hypothetical protein
MVEQKYQYQIDKLLPGLVNKIVSAGAIPAPQINKPMIKSAIAGYEQQQQSLKYPYNTQKRKNQREINDFCQSVSLRLYLHSPLSLTLRRSREPGNDQTLHLCFHHEMMI